jgi:hypothetical protein
LDDAADSILSASASPRYPRYVFVVSISI